jgi:hypothetical protein
MVNDMDNAKSVFPSMLNFTKKPSVADKSKDPRKRLPAFGDDENGDATPLNNSQRKKTSTKADRAARFGSTNKTATYEEVRYILHVTCKVMITHKHFDLYYR